MGEELGSKVELGLSEVSQPSGLPTFPALWGPVCSSISAQHLSNGMCFAAWCMRCWVCAHMLHTVRCTSAPCMGVHTLLHACAHDIGTFVRASCTL